ncbi:hypothetical protein [Paenibacillus silviterrae]|nr:hypothetical protein [Paenibacillus chinjuensis]
MTIAGASRQKRQEAGDLNKQGLSTAIDDPRYDEATVSQALSR